MRRATLASLSLMLASLASAQSPHPNLPDANTIGVFRWDHTGTQPGTQPNQNQCQGTPNNTNRGANTGFPQWIFDTDNSKRYDAPDQTYWFGLNCDIPIAGSWDGTKHLRVGTFWNGFWYADVNENHAWDAADLVYSFGVVGDIPVIGDWDHSGVLRIGVFRIDTAGNWGPPGLAWWVVNLHPCSLTDNTACSWRRSPQEGVDYELFQFGLQGDIPVVGDWDHTGVLRIGVFRPSSGWILNLQTTCPTNVPYPVQACNQFSGNPIGYPSFSPVVDKPVIGDWNVTQNLEIGMFTAGTWYVDANANNQWDGAPPDQIYSFGLGASGAYPEDTPVPGPWTPFITTISPSSGGAGTSVTITGSNFGAAQGSGTVSFNGVAAQVTSWASNQIVATVPAGATTGPITVQVAGCTAAACRATSSSFTITVTGTGQPTLSMFPAYPAGPSAYYSIQTFTFTATDPVSGANVSSVSISFENGGSACRWTYNPQSNLLYYAEGSISAGPYQPGVSSGNTPGSLCSTNLDLSTAGISGQTVTLILTITFANGFNSNAFMQAQSSSGNAPRQQTGVWYSALPGQFQCISASQFPDRPGQEI